MAYTTIDNPELYFQTKLYTGNGSTNAITLDGDEDMQPGMMWFKDRGDTESHIFVDAVRGATKNLHPDQNWAESTQSDRVTAIGSDGFTLGADTNNGINESSHTFVAWCWKESATSGFDIVTFTGTGSAKTEAHSLSAVPHVMLVMNRDSANNLHLYHHKNTSAPETDYLNINASDSTDDAATVWNDTVPTSSVFSVGTADTVNKNTDNILAYLWSEKQGFSKFGTYIGNGNADGPFVFCGFRPAFVLGKIYTDRNEWFMLDNKRDPFNLVDNTLWANENNAENNTLGQQAVDFLSNGFKIRDSDGTVNSSGNTYIFMAFAEAPFVNSNGVPCNAR